VDVLVSVPAGGRAVAALPLYVDREHVDPTTAYFRELEVLPLGATEPLYVLRAPLPVKRARAATTLGFVAALGSALAGFVLLLRGRRWLGEAGTPALVTVAMFGAASFVVGAAMQVFGAVVGWAFGPFTPLVVGLPDALFRTALLVTLIGLLPRVGTLAAATVVGYLMRGLTFGAWHPVDLLYVGASVWWYEAAAWGAGLTRGSAQERAQRVASVPRLMLAFCGANMAVTAAALAASVVLYRLFLAPWYIAAVVFLPGCLYVAIAVWVVAPFAASVRAVQR
jgi:hypothetical protein